MYMTFHIALDVQVKLFLWVLTRIVIISNITQTQSIYSIFVIFYYACFYKLLS